MLYRRKRDFEAASAFFFQPTHGLIEPHLKGNTTHLNSKTPMARRNESPLLWQTQFLQKVVVALMLLLSVAAVGHLVAFTRGGATDSNEPMIAASSAALCILKAVALVCIRDANGQAHCVSRST